MDLPPKGRGSASNPSNRFARLHYLEEPEERDEARSDAGGAGALRTRFYRDASRSAIATNQSPDLGFDASINPYRGCEHGCSYCLAADTPVLYADLIWRPLGGVRPGDVLVGFDELARPGHPRRLRAGLVEHVWWSRRPTLRVVGQETEVVATAEHRWLQARDFRWSRTETLSPGRVLRLLPVVHAEAHDVDYRAGYVSGLSLGDGTFRYQPGWRSDKLGLPAAWWRIALIDREPLERVVEFLAGFGVPVAIRPFSPGKATRTPMWKVETRSLSRLAVLYRLLSFEPTSRSYRRGFLAGFFDAEGHNGSSLRLSQVDLSVLERVRRYARALGFEFRLERRIGAASTLRLVGSVAERMRFFGIVRPAIRRKLDAILGRMPPTAPERLERVERSDVVDVVDIQTSTRTFYAAGLATHNCYARPTHEYLGWSAGLDFESRILVKEDLPALLRRELDAPAWKPRVIALSGNTDAYQPVERRLRLTRRCLEVLRDFRNPVAVVTKSALVARDADLLAELAADGAASVSVSVTTLEGELARRMEPRAAAPEQRLRAIESLALAGVPVGVMVAPIVPGLNDHEIPAIVSAAASAGARFAGRVVLRLPHGLRELFEDWLERAYPERRAKVLNRMLALHGGRLYDSRFGHRQSGDGRFAEQIDGLFELALRRAGLAKQRPPLSSAAFRRPAGQQLALFE